MSAGIEEAENREIEIKYTERDFWRWHWLKCKWSDWSEGYKLNKSTKPTSAQFRVCMICRKQQVRLIAVVD